MISGCKDDQRSAGVAAGTIGNEVNAGVLTTALHKFLTPSVSCGDLLYQMQSFIASNSLTQVPQMSSEQYVNIDCSFVNYRQSKRRGN